MARDVFLSCLGRRAQVAKLLRQLIARQYPISDPGYPGHVTEMGLPMGELLVGQ